METKMVWLTLECRGIDWKGKWRDEMLYTLVWAMIIWSYKFAKLRFALSVYKMIPQ